MSIAALVVVLTVPGQLELAQSFVAEAGWLAERDWAAMAHIHYRRAQQRGVTMAQQVTDYCAAFKRPSERRWVLGLNAELSEPPHWPQKLSWARHRPWWHQALRRAGQFLRAPERVKDPCKGTAVHFGGDMDDHRAARAGWRAVNCGLTRQRYWATR